MTTKDFRFSEYVDYQNQHSSRLYNRILGGREPTILELEEKIQDLTKLVNHLVRFINLTDLKVRCQINEKSDKDQP